MKKYLSMLFAALLAASVLCACASSEGAASSAQADTLEEAQTEAVTADVAETAEEASVAGANKVKIVTTIFPEYDWVMNILGEEAQNAEVTMLLDNGVDLHSFQPTAEDIMKIASCDLFVYVGGESDEWVEDALQEAINPNMIVVNLLEDLGDTVKEEEVVEGMQEEEHDHEHHHDEEDADDHEDHDEEDADDHEDHDEEDEDEHDHEHHHDEEEIEYDEHVWLSLRNAEKLVDVLSGALMVLDPERADTYAENGAAYIETLNQLDAKYTAVVSAANTKTVLFGDRFPFRYLVDDYDLSYYAAFVGCSAETEASFETVTFLAGKVDELGLSAVLTIEGKDHRIAETIVQNTKTRDQKILTMDSMQATTAEDVAAGVTYLSIMSDNLQVLTQALQ